MSKAANLPPCPRCGTAKHVTTNGHGDGLLFVCNQCRGLFDQDPDEGGSHYSDPSKRMEREEEFRARQRERNRRRFHR